MVYRFGIFEFDTESNGLRKSGRAVALEPQPARALALLLARAGDVVSREEIRDAVWGRDTHVDFDRGLAYCVSQIRTALNDSGENPRFVQTIPRRGFKFIVPVTSDIDVHSLAPSLELEPATLQARSPLIALVAAVAIGIAFFGLWATGRTDASPVVIAVSVFDNETGNADYDRIVTGLSDLVVEHLTKLDPARISVIGNAAVLRQPRNTRNLKGIAESVRADYVLLGQLQKGETGLRFITHFIRLKDEAHLKANRLQLNDANLAGLESAVVNEFDRAVREHVLKRASN